MIFLRIAVLLLMYSFGALSAQTIDSVSALRLAEEYFGLNRTIGDSAFIVPGSVELSAKALKDELPFAEEIQIGAYWKVTFDGVKLWSEGSCATPSIHDVYVDATDGRFLYSVRRRCDQSATSELETEAIAFCIPQLVQNSYYEFVSYVDSAVTLPLTAALHKAAFSHPCRSATVISYLLDLKDPKGNEFNAWLITGVDGPASDLAGPDGPARETWLTMVDAESGQQILAAQIDVEACARSK